MPISPAATRSRRIWLGSVSFVEYVGRRTRLAWTCHDFHHGGPFPGVGARRFDFLAPLALWGFGRPCCRHGYQGTGDQGGRRADYRNDGGHMSHWGWVRNAIPTKHATLAASVVALHLNGSARIRYENARRSRSSMIQSCPPFARNALQAILYGQHRRKSASRIAVLPC